MESLETTPHQGTYTISLKVGNYLADEISLHVKNHTLTVKGLHNNVTKYCYEKNEFARQFKLPKEVVIESLRYELTREGVLKIEADKNFVRVPFQDKSDCKRLRLSIDVEDYKSDEVKVSHQGNILLIQGSMEARQHRKDAKSFKKIIALYPDVDLCTLRCKRTKDAYLEVCAARNLKNIEKESHVVPIRWCQ